MSDCSNCARLVRLNNCNGGVKDCQYFIDKRAGCRRCSYVKSCMTLGKKVGIYHLCTNFEKGSPPYLNADVFDDYGLYLEKKKIADRKENSKPSKKSLVRKKKLEHLEELEQADKIAEIEKLDTSIYENQPDDWSPELVVDKVVNSEFDPRVFNLVNDGDIIKPDNPVSFMIEPHFLNVNLFPRQLQIALNYFAAYCPYCSDSKFIRNGIEVDTPTDEILDRAVLYKNGKCPQCGKTRYEAIEDGRLGNYSTFVGLCGQRCISGNSLIISREGLKRISGYYNQVLVQDNLFIKPSNLFRYDKTKVISIYLDNLNIRITGSYNHPLLTDNRFVELQYLNLEDNIVVQYGTRVFGQNKFNQIITKEDKFLSVGLLEADEESQRYCILSAFTKKENKYSFTTNNEELIYDIAIVFINIGIKYKIEKLEDTYTISYENLDIFTGKYLAKVSNIVYEDKPITVYDYEIPVKHQFIANGIVNHNSGKSVSHGIFAATVLAQYLCLPNPVAFMKQLESVTFRMTFVGLRYVDAYENLWQDFYNNITNTPWFRTYNQFLTDEGIRLGKELFKVKDSFALYTIKGLAAIPAGPDKRKLRGRCIVGNTLINTNYGIIRANRIISYINKYDDVTVSVLGNNNKIVEFIPQGKKSCVTLTFSNGISISVTHDHKIPIWNPEKKDFDLVQAKDTKGKFVVNQLWGRFPLKLDKKLLPNIISDDLLKDYEANANRYIGALLGKLARTCIYNKNLETFVCKSDKDTINSIKYLIKKIYGEKLEGDSALVLPNNIIKHLSSINFLNKPYSPCISSIILVLPKNQVIEYIINYLDKNKDRMKLSKNTVIFNLDNENSALYLHQIINKLGYYCIKRNNDVILMHNSANHFLNEIFNYTKKRPEKIDNVYKIPGQEIYTWSKYNNISYYDIDPKLDDVIDKDIVFVQVTDCKDIGEKEVFDIGIESKDHLFPANNILVHNTRYWASMDEVGHFTGKDGNMMLDADEVSIALDNSLTTLRVASNRLLHRFPDVPTAHAFYISSPRNKLDKIMRLYKQSKVIDSYYGVRHCTWDFNPNIKREDLNDKFLSDPIGAERDFAANPPFGDDPFISNPADIVNLLSEFENSFEVKKYKTIEDSLGGRIIYPVIKTHKHNLNGMLAIDAGYNNNSFAICFLHKIADEDDEENDEYDEENESYKTACSGLLEFRPRDGIPLSFPKIYEKVICKIIENFDVRLVAFDRWQSINMRQMIDQDFGIPTLQYSVKMNDFINLKSDILGEKLMLPELEQDIQEIISLDKELDLLIENKPVSHLMLQLLTSKNNGRTITKGDETSDDLLRALCLGHSIINNPEYFEYFAVNDEDITSSNVNFIAIGVGSDGNVIGRSGGSSGTYIPGIGLSISAGGY